MTDAEIALYEAGAILRIRARVLDDREKELNARIPREWRSTVIKRRKIRAPFEMVEEIHNRPDIPLMDIVEYLDRLQERMNEIRDITDGVQKHVDSEWIAAKMREIEELAP